MENQQELFKGELMEEKLRLYFLNSGYYVVRGIKYSYESNEITDIDLMLYGRVSILNRIRTNVDIKNKKSPKAFERILWTKGVQELLKFDNCVVATMDRKESVRRYAEKHDITLLDGRFLQKLNYTLTDRISEEELLAQFGKYLSYKEFPNQNWKSLYEKSKSSLLEELDFSGYNTNLLYLKYFFNKTFDPQKKDTAIRATYIFLSHNLLILDYILKDIAFLEPEERKTVLGNGFKYGNLGEEGLKRTIEMAIKISGSRYTASQIKKIIDEIDIEILREFFSKQETIKNLFKWAIAFEKLAFSKVMVYPNDIDIELKSLVAMFLDYYKLNRKSYFDQ